MTCGIVITRHKIHCWYDPATGGSVWHDYQATLLPRGSSHAPAITPERETDESFTRTVLFDQYLYQSSPYPSHPINPHSRHPIKHRALTAAVSSLEAYSTPAR